MLTLGLVPQRYQHHLKRHDEVLLELENVSKKSREFEQIFKEFEVGFVF